MKRKIYISLAFLLGTLFTNAQDVNTSIDSIHNGPYFETENGISVSGYYKDNLKTGNWIKFLKNGQVNTVEYFERGVKNGISLIIDKRGYISEQAEYLNDKLYGKKMVYSAGGKPKLIENYKNGILDGDRKSVV